MTEISDEVKKMLITDIQNSNIQGLHDTLNIILEKPDNPNIIPVEFKLSTIRFLEEVREDLLRSSSGKVEYDLPQVVELMINMAIPAYRATKKQKAKVSP